MYIFEKLTFYNCGDIKKLRLVRPKNPQNFPSFKKLQDRDSFMEGHLKIL